MRPGRNRLELENGDVAGGRDLLWGFRNHQRIQLPMRPTRNTIRVPPADRIPGLATGIDGPRLHRRSELDDHAPTRPMDAVARKRTDRGRTPGHGKLWPRKRGDAQQMINVRGAHMIPPPSATIGRSIALARAVERGIQARG